MGFFNQLRLLMWKNFILQIRKKCVTVFEVILPLVFIVFLVLMRISTTVRIKDGVAYKSYDLDSSSFYYGGNVLFSPNKTKINQLMRDVAHALGRNYTAQFQGFSSQDELLQFYKVYPDKVKCAVVFEESQNYDNSLPLNTRYSMRFGGQWNTDKTYPFNAFSGQRSADYGDEVSSSYGYDGFLTLQYRINTAITKMLSNKNSTAVDSIKLKMHQMPYPAYREDDLNMVLNWFFPLFVMLSFIFSSMQLTKSIIYEKENKLRETMKLMGLSSSVYWMSWCLKGLIYLLVASFLYVLMCTVPFAKAGGVLTSSNPVLIYLFFACYSLSIIAFCFFVSTLFKKANNGLFAVGVLHFFTFFPYFFLIEKYETWETEQKFGISILHNMCMAFGIRSMLLYESTGKGVQFSNFYKPAVIGDGFSLLDAMLMFLVDSVLYFLLAWYIDTVRPGEYGVPRPFYFPFTKSYWCGSEHKLPTEENSSSLTDDSKFFERNPAGLEVGIKMKDLRKEYGNFRKSKVAVFGTNLNIYKGQVTALLGHNGAGKTTTMSMLTGFIPPTSGSAEVNGYDIKTDIASVHKSLGVCPQHNILFDTLTVQEHLEFYAGLKGCPRKLMKEEVDKIINMFDLGPKRNSQSHELSGGQKRKLSVGIALVGGSEVIILDEPTSGMDPGARRQMWDILQNYKQNRTILFSTHMMDEADVLGDRIAIMHEGVVKCCGASLFLKKLYGAGYHLVIVKARHCDTDNEISMVRNFVPTAMLESDVGSELSILLPFDQSQNFQALFTDIEATSEDMGISSFGISATTMEEVFLKVGEYETEDKTEEMASSAPVNIEEIEINGQEDGSSTPRHSINGIQDETAVFIASGKEKVKPESAHKISMRNLVDDQNFIDFNVGLQKNTGISLSIQKCYGMFIKKMLHTVRNKTVTVVQLLLPVVFTILALVENILITRSLENMDKEPPLKLDLTPFQPYAVVTYSLGDPQTSISDKASALYTQMFKNAGFHLETFTNVSGGLNPNLVNVAASEGLSNFNRKYIIGGQFETSAANGDSTFTSFFNQVPYHSTAVSLSYMTNVILKLFTNESCSITTRNYPLPYSVTYTRSSDGSQSMGILYGLLISITIMFGMSFLIASFVVFLIRERKTGSKHLQVVSGVGPISFWLSTFLWDFINYLIPIVVILICFVAFQTHAYVDDGRIGILLLVFLCYGWAVLPLVYFLQFLFTSPACGMATVTILNILTGLGTVLTVSILRSLAIVTSSLKDASKITDWVFTVLLPHHGLGGSLSDIYTNYNNKKICETYSQVCSGPNKAFDYNEKFMGWEYPGCGRYIVFMLIQGFVFFGLVMLVEYRVLYRCFYGARQTLKHNTPAMSAYGYPVAVAEDSDVLEERNRIDSTPLQTLMNTDSLIIKNLTKSYGFGNICAVDNISVGVPKEECFGLLGQNGAGKTSTFKMLTGDTIVTSGNAFIDTFDIQQNIKKVQAHLGYCPQFDALLDYMTGRETLTMFARLRGVEEKQIKDVVKKLLDIMTLQKYSDKRCGRYSGGNKRKLSTAISIVGDPPFILLDEPTTGVDPVARRQLWNVLSQIRASGRTLILTSHSMEECDALCTRIVIMVNGKFVCLGSPQHLKNKFGQGLTLIVRLAPTTFSEIPVPDPSAQLQKFIHQQFPGSFVFDDNQGYLHFQIPDRSTSLAHVFGVMENAKNMFSFEDYSVHQTTLEQVFLAFTRHQTVVGKAKKSFCNKLCACCICCA